MRLDRVLANAGYGSRKEVRSLIRSGAVSLDGQTLKEADHQITDGDLARLCLNGEALKAQFSFYFALHKPQGYLSAMEDKKLPCVSAFLPERFKAVGLFPVGRLDIDTTGLLLFTNDGTLGHRLSKPEWHVEKRYRFDYAGPLLGENETALLAEGLALNDYKCRPARLCLPEQAEAQAELVLVEGKFHQVKRMVAALGREVTRLERLSHGPVTLAGIPEPTQIRPLSEAEIDALYQATGLTRPAR